MTRPYALPSLTALTCFEAAARLGSFKEAARELNVTPAAISHQVKALETDLHQDLFRRRHRGVELTESGAYLLVALQRGFEGISAAVRDIRGTPDAEDVTVHATTAVSALWLTPQLSTFWRDHPGIVISQLVGDIDPPDDRVDLAIHYGPPPAGGGEHRTLFRDDIVALGAPGFAAGIRSLSDLAVAPLIHVTARDDWTGWPDWLARFGAAVPPGRRLTVNNYMIALQLAQDGIGAVLGWRRLVGGLIEQGKLVQLRPEEMPSPHVFHLRLHPRASERARIFADWLAEG